MCSRVEYNAPPVSDAGCVIWTEPWSTLPDLIENRSSASTPSCSIVSRPLYLKGTGLQTDIIPQETHRDAADDSKFG